MSTAGVGAASAAGGAFKRESRTIARGRNPYREPKIARRAKEKQFYRDIARARGATDWRGKPIYTPYTWNIRPGDLVQVTQPALVKDYASQKPKQNQYGQTMTHKWLGQQGRVLAVLRKQERVIVEGVNLRTRQMRPTVSDRSYQFTEESPIPYQWVRLVDPSNGLPASRVKRVALESGGFTRILRETGTVLPVPPREKKVPVANERVDTRPDDALRETYVKPEYTHLATNVAKDANGQPLYVEEEVPLTKVEMAALAKRAHRMTPEEKALYERGVRVQRSAVFEDENVELRAARIKF